MRVGWSGARSSGFDSTGPRSAIGSFVSGERQHETSLTVARVRASNRYRGPLPDGFRTDLSFRFASFGDGRMLHADSLALASERPIHRWHNDAARQEESIPSVERKAHQKMTRHEIEE